MPKTEVISLRIPTQTYLKIRDARVRIQQKLRRPVTLSETLRLVVDLGVTALLEQESNG